MATATRGRQQTLSKADATRFNRYSPENANKVLNTLKCGCQPYQDVFTYNRWRALGYQVKRGQKAVRIPVIIDKENEDGEHVKRFWRSSVFCRHQVQDGSSPEPQAEPQAENIMEGFSIV